MKVKFEEIQKRNKAALAGDIMQYQLEDGSIVNGIIVMVRSGEYSMLNLETCICGSVKADSPNKLVREYNDRKNFVLYRKCEWDAVVNIKPKQGVFE